MSWVEDFSLPFGAVSQVGGAVLISRQWFTNPGTSQVAPPPGTGRIVARAISGGGGTGQSDGNAARGGPGGGSALAGDETTALGPVSVTVGAGGPPSTKGGVSSVSVGGKVLCQADSGNGGFGVNATAASVGPGGAGLGGQAANCIGKTAYSGGNNGQPGANAGANYGQPGYWDGTSNNAGYSGGGAASEPANANPILLGGNGASYGAGTNGGIYPPPPGGFGGGGGAPGSYYSYGTADRGAHGVVVLEFWSA